MRAWDKVALVFAAVAALCVVLITAFSNVADRQLAASQAKVRVPERVAFYEKLAKPEATPVTQSPDAQAPPQAEANSADPVQIARDTITAYSELFAKVTALGDEWERDNKPLLDSGPPMDAPDVPRELIEQIIETAKRGGPVSLLNFTSWNLMELTHLERLHFCAVLVSGYALERLAAGDSSEALRGIMAVMDLADALSCEPLIQSFQVRQQCYRLAMVTMAPAKLNPELAKPLMDRLSKAGNRAALREVLAGDLQVELHAFEAWKNESYTGMVSRVGFYWGTRSWIWATPVCKPWFDKDQQITIDMMARMMEVEDAPYYKVKPALDRIQADVDALSFMNAAAAPRVRWQLGAFTIQAHFESELNIKQLQIAIEQYRRAHDAYPETLDAVSEWFGGTLPVNPFDGKPYGYTSDGKTYSLDKAQLDESAGR